MWDLYVRRLTVAVVVLACAGLTPQPSQAAGWFWNEVPWKIKDGSRAHALSVVRTRQSRGQTLVSRKRVAGVLRRWRSELVAGAQRARIPPALMAAIVTVESAGNPKALSHAGAQGLAQLMPGTAARFGVTNAYDPVQNLKGAGAYLRFLMRRYRGDLVLVLAAYNAGEGAVDRYGGVPPFKETRAYVPKVLAAYDLATRLGSGDESKKYTWFWKDIPAKRRAGSRSGALEFVRAERARGRKMFGSKAALQRIVRKWRKALEQGAARGKISEALLASIVLVSGANPRGMSPMGAVGLGHLPPEVAKKYRVKNLYDPAQNLAGSAAYLSDLLNQFRGDLVLALAAYNAGADAVRRHDGVPPYGDTKAFVPKVLSAFALASTFCATPPDAPRRQCAFQ
ncbi:MAG: lytic transglycosylase domain-containing protein [Pseudomonadota bacterium]